MKCNTTHKPKMDFKLDKEVINNCNYERQASQNFFFTSMNVKGLYLYIGILQRL